jgi:hypothetical protein
MTLDEMEEAGETSEKGVLVGKYEGKWLCMRPKLVGGKIL